MKLLNLLVGSTVLFSVYAYKKENRPLFHPNRPIVGGSNAEITNYPFQISFQLYKSADTDAKEYGFNHFCGGTIISVEWVLTAAHCAINLHEYSELRKQFWIRAGTNVKNEGGSLHQISHFIMHPRYRGPINNYDFDVALLKVKPLFEFGPTIQPIKLNNHPLETGGIVTVIGWGTTSYRGDLSVILQKVQVPILPQWECRLTYGREEYNITQNMFCAGRAGRSACHGDSGGPVLYKDVQIGISSWTIGCHLPDYPVVYANVYSMRSWIHENTGV